jgi:tetratricopeptide (TPR) repeat protein
MARPAVRRRGPRAPRRIAALAALVLASTLVRPSAGAQPAPELERARDLYASGEAAMRDGRFDDAVRDYGAAYELSKDPALFFKIGRANEAAGRCAVAIIYYRRYLREGNPTEQFSTTTQDRIGACGGDAPGPSRGTSRGTSPIDPLSGPAGPGEPTPSAQPGGPPSEPSPRAGRDGAPADPPAGPTPAPTADSPPAPPDTPADSATAGPADGAARAVIATPNTHHKVAWLLTGSAFAVGTLGGILAFAANSSENDVRDLYVGFAGEPATFDAQTRQRYDELVAQGRRYERLSWAAFGLTAAAAAGAAVLFVLGDRDEAAPPPRVAPVVTPTSAGVAVRF